MAQLNKLSGSITTEDALGKDVIDSKGSFLGVCDKIYMNPKSLQVLAISIDKGFMKKGLVIGLGYVREVANHAVFLNVEPAFKIKGMGVFDKDGAFLGHVKQIELSNDLNKIHELILSKPLPKFGTLVVKAEYIDRIEGNVFLNITKNDFLNKESMNKN